MTNTIVDLLYKNNHINKDEIEAYKVHLLLSAL